MKSITRIIVLILLIVILLPNQAENETLAKGKIKTHVVLTPKQQLEMINKIAKAYKRNLEESYALIMNESDGYADARPPILELPDGTVFQEGSYGLCAVKYETLAWVKSQRKHDKRLKMFGENLLNPVDNFGWSTAYLDLLETKYRSFQKVEIDGVPGNKYLAYVAYNLGHNYVDKYLAKGEFPKSDYASNILNAEKQKIVIKKGYEVKHFKVKSIKAWYSMHKVLYNVSSISVDEL
jgi:hypothetical protein